VTGARESQAFRPVILAVDDDPGVSSGSSASFESVTRRTTASFARAPPKPGWRSYEVSLRPVKT